MLSLTWEEHGNVKFGMKEPEWILQLGMGMKMCSADPLYRLLVYSIIYMNLKQASGPGIEDEDF